LARAFRQIISSFLQQCRGSTAAQGGVRTATVHPVEIKQAGLERRDRAALEAMNTNHNCLWLNERRASHWPLDDEAVPD
jgi:hypothetical protein